MLVKDVGEKCMLVKNLCWWNYFTEIYMLVKTFSVCWWKVCSWKNFSFHQHTGFSPKYIPKIYGHWRIIWVIIKTENIQCYYMGLSALNIRFFNNFYTFRVNYTVQDFFCKLSLQIYLSSYILHASLMRKIYGPWFSWASEWTRSIPSNLIVTLTLIQNSP